MTPFPEPKRSRFYEIFGWVDVKSYSLKARWFLFPVLGAFLIFAFQNCGQQFTVSDDFFKKENASLSAAPTITLVSAPDMVNSASITISFDVDFATSSAKSVLCQLGTETPKDCSANSITLDGLADGDYSLKIVAENMQGATAEVIKVFRKDTTVPTLVVSSMPSAVTNQVNANFVFTATDALSGVLNAQCSLDNAAFATCTSPASATGLAMGSHNYRIRVNDRAGNISAVYTYTWTIDLTAPTVTISANPLAVTNQVNATFVFSGAGIVSYECQIDNGAYAACTSPRVYNALANGVHTFRARGTNLAGTVSAAAQFTWTVDNVAPAAPNLTSDVGASTPLKAVSFTFSSTDSGSGVALYECSLDNATFSACTSPRALTNLAVGSHNFRVKSFDNAGNESAVSSFSWTITIVPVTVTLGWDPNTEATLAGYKIYIGTSPNNYTNSIDVGNRAPVGGVVSYPVPNLVPGTTYYFTVVAYDSAKVESAASNEISKMVQ